MQISFRSVQNADPGLELHQSLALPRVTEDNKQVQEMEPIQADLKAELTGSHICRVHGTLHTTVKYQCSRCLDSTSQTLEAAFDESFTDQSAKADEDTHFVGDDEIKLDPYIEESINLALEYCPVCDVDCKGLCPVCGCNRNRTTCECDTRTVDPRLAALKDLLSSDDPQ